MDSPPPPASEIPTRTSPTRSTIPTAIRAVLDVDDGATEPLPWQHCLYFFPLPHGHGSFLPGVFDMVPRLLPRSFVAVNRNVVLGSSVISACILDAAFRNGA